MKTPQVRPDRWCVTRHDLWQLKKEVVRAICEGFLNCHGCGMGQGEDSQDNEDYEDVYGPSIYIVNEQYIKPVTAEAGKVSWALMRNPEGLDCDVFVSHAWQEGVFEFLSKLRCSWPWAARNAWCCMLANPQHLNIGSMLLSPKTSPFALALQASKTVLVVANRHKSIYCRLWCGYEAYVASEDAKVIRIAAAPLANRMCCVVVVSLCAFFSAYFHGPLRQASNYAGLVATASMELSFDPTGKGSEFHELGLQLMDGRLTWIGLSALFVIAELDRAWSSHIEEEGELLRKRYSGSVVKVEGEKQWLKGKTAGRRASDEGKGIFGQNSAAGAEHGSIRWATCSQPTDQQNIWDEIGDKVDEVDHAIHVLITAGISSPSLRAAAKLGVDINHAGHAEAAVAFVALGPLLVLSACEMANIACCELPQTPLGAYQAAHICLALGDASFLFSLGFSLLGMDRTMALPGRAGPKPFVPERQEVLKAIQSGQIASPSSTSSQSDDDSETSMDDDYYYGPSIYTVNEQYIKPVTAHAGKMSWALMRNPYGLKCSMLQSPRSSPFALALQAASYVMVVPNRHKSVYSRLWCGYEAYVASEDAKIIRIATAPSRKPMGLALLGASLPMLLGTSLGILARVFDWEVRVEGVLVATLAALLSAFTRKRCNQEPMRGPRDTAHQFVTFQALPPPIENIAQHVTFLGFTSYFVLAESDRVRSLQIEEEGRQLRKGYQGSIRFADCTGAADRQNIWDEIGDKAMPAMRKMLKEMVDAVDHAVHVLISAGVSSPALRCAEEQGVDIQDAGHAEVAIAVFLGPFLCLSILNPTVVILVDEQTTLSWTNTSVVLLGAFARLMFLVVMCARSLDERSFMLKVISKLMTSVGLPAVSVIAVIVHFNDHVASLVVKWVFTRPSFPEVAKLDDRLAYSRYKDSSTAPSRCTMSSRSITSTALEMHQKVSPDRWCVTRLDLKYLHVQVLEAVQAGQIFSRSCSGDTAGTQESEDDDEFGPSIYTVTEQYIKPVTAEAGKMSWALMRNPFGLDCDLFVSHAWQEGIFEFLSKVLTSWPSGAHHAWCCMLANPQNLNVGSMLLSPRMSPFALALQASSHVLVVPNRHRSVYTRLWCCFEAYVASEEDKTIEIATAPSGFAQRRALLQALVPLTMGLVIGAIGRLTHLTLRVETAVAVFSSICAFVSAYSLRWRRVANYFGLLAAGNLEVRWDPKHLQEFQLLPPVIEEICQRLVWLSAIAFFLVAELDRVRSWHLAEEGQQLRKDFKGSIRFASCTRPGDMMNIWDEIGHKVDAVDNAIDVLISAGISSPALRSAAVKGVDITGAGHADGAISFVVLGPLQLISVKNAIQMHLSFAPTPQAFWWQAIFALIGVMASLICTVLIGVRPVDERAFLMKVMTKLCTVIFIPIAVGLGIAESYGGHAALSALQELFVCFHILMIVALFFAVSGIRGTLALPGGKCILQYFLVRRSRERLRASSSLSESDTE
ncbi:unnamed protein product [Durusdinium trenchii]|uniref:H(+)-exporting diphosphatase n=2 Tax=Durusdinium trenchii TaxID=1381693 RepID=A0ABP0LNN0_9DINO